MANLETISIEIAANTSRASQGVSALIGSLTNLTNVMTNAASGAVALNNALAQLQRFANMHLPSVSNFAPGGTTSGVTQANTAANIAQTTQATQQYNNALNATGQTASNAARQVRNLGGTMNQISRITRTMLIRTALKAVMKAFKESWNAAYEFSKHLGGSFAKAVDATKTMLADTTTSLIQTFAPVLEAAVPVIYTITQAIQYLCSGLQQLFKLLGLTSDLFGKSVSSINKYYGSSSKANKAQKNLLASWDELNVIQHKNNSSSGASYNPGSLKNFIKGEVTGIMQFIVGEAMIALGFILAATGHIPLGISCIAIGASAIVKTITTDWSKLPDGVKSTIETITKIVAVAYLALGTILLCTGHIPLGIGLVAMGVAHIAAAVYMNDAPVTNNITNTLEKIAIIAGSSLLAIGVLLCCAGILPIGIGMIVAGIASLGGAVAINWDGDLLSSIQKVLNKVSLIFQETYAEICKKVDEAWASVKQWWEDTGIGPKVREVWGEVKKTLTAVWSSASRRATNAWNKAKCWWEESGIGEKVRTAWAGVSAFFKELWGDAEAGTGIAGWAKETWDGLKKWWETNVSDAIQKEGVWGGVTAFFTGMWTDIKTESLKVWDDISKWWDTNISSNISTAWDSITEFFHNLFGSTEVPGSIADIIHSAWQTVSEWWTTNIYDKVKGAWDTVTGFFGTLFGSGEGSIENFFLGMWSNIELLWGDIIGSVKAAWESIGTWFYNNVTMPIGNFFIDCVNGIIDGVNWLIGVLNSINITIPAVSLPLIGQLWGETKVGISGIALIDKLQRLAPITENADGAYGIPNGDLFIANERGAELVGQIGGKTSVANQGQIIEGIRAGVSDANAEQNKLLTQQNELLRAILNKEWKAEPSAAWGKFNQRSDEMWAMVTGR